MNQATKPSPHPYHHVFVDNNRTDLLILAIDTGNDNWDYWRVDEIGHSRDSKLDNKLIKCYWQDHVTLKTIQNTVKVLDFYVKAEDNIVEMPNNNFTADDIPF